MDHAVQALVSRRALHSIARSQTQQRIHSQILKSNLQRLAGRNIRLSPIQVRRSSSSSSSPPPPSDDKSIILEKPDKFRPPSHGSRLKARCTTGTYGAGAAYNQSMSAREREASKQKSYPHMFPNEGTFMHWFLTARWIHVGIAMVVLMSLAVWSAISTWAQTSPYAHLIPSLSTFPFHPFIYLSELLSVYRLHIEYTTQKTAEMRRQNILDAQKRRLYRRAHGMEDLNADEISGPDVRGLVEWDDGLTGPERERGGQFKPEMIGANMMAMGARPGENLNQAYERRRAEEGELQERRAVERESKKEEEIRAEEERLVRIGAKREERKPKLWFGIW